MPRNRKVGEDFIAHADMYVAYRKAKSEAFHDGLHPSALAFSKYEVHLQRNLSRLRERLLSADSRWYDERDFIGDFLYIPKSVDDSIWDSDRDVHYRLTDPNEDWARRFKESGQARLEAKYRLVMAPTVDYQIISALWILKVGHKFEEKLDKNLSFGNRIRRRRHSLEDFGPFNGPVNRDAVGLFVPYFSAYRKWRQNGLDVMRSLLEEGKSVTAVTMDLASFYHRVSPRFLLRRSFLERIGVTLNKDEADFTQHLLDSIDVWYRSTPDYEERTQGALPVGLSASKVISNVLLFEFDNDVKDSIRPAYYGRYVDDIFLVFESSDEISSGNDVVRHLSKTVRCLKLKRRKGDHPSLRLDFRYAEDSELVFTASKQRIFCLKADHGIDLVDQIGSQIRQQSSEYRLLPELPETTAEMAEKALLATPDASLVADALRKADSISVRRLGLALLVRDIERYSTDLVRGDWESHRREFYGLVARYLVAPKGLFDLFNYFHRVFRLMISNFDFKEAEGFVSRLVDCFKLVESTTQNESGKAMRIKRCKAYFAKVLIQAALQSSTTRDFDQWAKLRRVLKAINELDPSIELSLRKSDLENSSRSLLLADMGVRPYKDYWYYSQDRDISEVPVPKMPSVRKVLKLASVRKFRQSAELKQPHWPALAFPTRPLTIQEIALISPDVLSDHQLFKRSVEGLRGAKTWPAKSLGRVGTSAGTTITAPRRIQEKTLVALTNVETTEQQFRGAIRGRSDRSLKRYERINDLVNGVLRTNPRTDYVVFPECSIPHRWAIRIASHLATQGISLIAGLEHRKVRKSRAQLRNDCLISLATRWPGYPSSLLILQPKLKPAYHEKDELRKVAKKELFIPNLDELPIYEHGGFYFGVLICSDLTTPMNRVRFQGNVDALFVLEWNSDLKTFSSLIEASAHDIHAFVVQVNNRTYGDSRVRAPFRAEYKRDSVRVKGGIRDYFVMAEIDFMALRRFQRRRRMSTAKAEFKPVPIGFKMSKERRKR